MPKSKIVAAEKTIKQYQMPVYDIRPGESLDAALKRLSKTADQRLVRLERLSQKDGLYTGVNQYAYKNAMFDIAQFGGTNRFNTKNVYNPEMSDIEKMAVLNSLKRFLNAPTSTKKGIDQIMKNRADTFNKKHGTNFTWQELARYFEKGLADKMDAKFKYNNALTLVKKLKATDNKYIEDINEALDINLKLPQEKTLDAIVESINKSGLDHKKVIKLISMLETHETAEKARKEKAKKKNTKKKKTKKK